MEDLPQLPYLNAFVKEVHRLRTIAIITPPHRAQEDIWYQGKLIPKGSQIVLNAWDVLHKPEYYDNPDSFDPDRFIRSPYGTKPGLENRISVDALKKMELVPFGWGKRRCVGMPMANESSALGTAHLFWAFEFRGEVDKNGVEIKPDIDRCAQKLGNDPLPFKCKITPRSSRRVEVIKHNYTQSTPVLEQFETELSKEDREHVEGVRNKLQGL
ncbi:hypothetical protein FRC03_007002 [Tulasnella sp. 419]|nr:hypothetical protein FRC03_007002 [Tulasnella sp. 419]